MVLNTIAALAASGVPADAVTSSINQVVGYGLLGILVLAFIWLFVIKQWRVISPTAEAAIRATARTEGRDDLVRENARLIEQNKELAEQRDDALKIAQNQIVPLLTSFNATTTALLPMLQRTVEQEAYGPGNRRRG